MKYILMMQGKIADWKAQNSTTWPPGAFQAHIDFLISLNKTLTESGELASVVALTSPEESRIVRAGPGGQPAITDGPFPEAKEFLAGYWIVDVDSHERALQIAAVASTAPGPDGAPMNMPIEVRPVMGAPGEEM